MFDRKKDEDADAKPAGEARDGAAAALPLRSTSLPSASLRPLMLPVALVKSRVVCKSERKLLDASVRLPWRPPSVREA